MTSASQSLNWAMLVKYVKQCQEQSKFSGNTGCFSIFSCVYVCMCVSVCMHAHTLSCIWSSLRVHTWFWTKKLLWLPILQISPASKCAVYPELMMGIIEASCCQVIAWLSHPGWLMLWLLCLCPALSTVFSNTLPSPRTQLHIPTSVLLYLYIFLSSLQYIVFKPT